MGIEQYTYWNLTINNPDDNDYLIVRNPNEKYVRSFVWTLEKGEEGTIHIQAWMRLQRNQTMKAVKKLYPRAHLKPCDRDEYNENSHQYAQKNDETTVGNHVITINDPLPGVDTVLYKVLERAYDAYDTTSIDRKYEEEDWKEEYSLTEYRLRNMDWGHIKRWSQLIEEDMVSEKAGLEKLFISATYEKMKQRFWRNILLRIKHNQQNAREDERRESTSEVPEEVEEADDGPGDCGEDCG